MQAHVGHEPTVTASQHYGQSHIKPERSGLKARTIHMIKYQQIVAYPATVVDGLCAYASAPLEIWYIMLTVHKTNIHIN